MTVVERVNSERVVLFGWSRAILLQIAHPLVAAGVLDHSSFRGGMIQAARRLHHTVGAMLSLTFGGEQAHAETVARIRGIHRRVHGTLRAPVGRFPAGTRYSAEDPALLLWVHATLVDSIAGIYTRVVAPLGAPELDLLCREAAPLVEELGGRAHDTPLSWRALQQYLEEMYASGTLEVSRQSRALADAVLSPRIAGLPLPLGGVHRLITYGLLPAPVRALYGVRWSASRERRFLHALRLLRAMRRIAPPRLALWPAARAHFARPLPPHERADGYRLAASSAAKSQPGSFPSVPPPR
jgi:uncharacterized protein (DUF2236 family)